VKGILYFLLVYSSLALAEQTYTLEYLIQTAQQNNHNYLAQQQQQQQIDMETESWNRSPSLNLSSNLSDSGSASTSLSLKQPLYQNGNLSIKKDLSSLNYNNSQWQTKRTAQTLILQITIAWYDLLEAQAKFDSANDAIDRLQEHARHSALFFEQGQVWRSDVLQAQLEIAKGQQTLISAKNTILRRKVAINLLIGAVNIHSNSQFKIIQ
jgi:outer membrane protein TolC